MNVDQRERNTEPGTQNTLITTNVTRSKNLIHGACILYQLSSIQLHLLRIFHRSAYEVVATI